jgi:hypothetical protein
MKRNETLQMRLLELSDLTVYLTKVEMKALEDVTVEEIVQGYFDRKKSKALDEVNTTKPAESFFNEETA